MTPGEKREGQRIIDIFSQGKIDEALRLLMQMYDYWPDKERVRSSYLSGGDGPRVA